MKKNLNYQKKRMKNKMQDKKQIKEFNSLVNRNVAEKLQEIADNLPISYLGVEGITKNLINKEIKNILKEESNKLLAKQNER